MQADLICHNVVNTVPRMVIVIKGGAEGAKNTIILGNDVTEQEPSIWWN